MSEQAVNDLASAARASLRCAMKADDPAVAREHVEDAHDCTARMLDLLIYATTEEAGA